MRIACLQFAPQLGKPSSNVDRANTILEARCPQNIDLLVLPELAFAGYNHPSLSAIIPYLEPTCSGLSSDWARATAARLSCVVTIGYAELYTPLSLSSAPQGVHPEQIVAHNSTVTISSDGSVLAHYRKTHLYMTDETWAQPSPQGWLSTPLSFSPRLQTGEGINVAFGICMDLNPYKFQAPWTDYEFASSAQASQSEIIILSMAWLTNSSSAAFGDEKEEPDLDTLSYWIERLRPLVIAEKEVLVICSNRCGEEPGRNLATPDSEGGVRYAGSSWVGLIGKKTVKIWGILGREQEDLLLVDTTKDPKLVLSMDQREYAMSD